MAPGLGFRATRPRGGDSFVCLLGPSDGVPLACPQSSAQLSALLPAHQVSLTCRLSPALACIGGGPGAALILRLGASEPPPRPPSHPDSPCLLAWPVNGLDVPPGRRRCCAPAKRGLHMYDPPRAPLPTPIVARSFCLSPCFLPFVCPFARRSFRSFLPPPCIVILAGIRTFPHHRRRRSRGAPCPCSSATWRCWPRCRSRWPGSHFW